jgi:hypothetical protein
VTPLVVAQVLHAANRALCVAHGDASHMGWEFIGQDARGHFVRMAEQMSAKLPETPEAMHELWMRDHLDRGWSYGPEKDVPNKRHPCLVPFAELSELEQAKDRLVIAIVAALLPQGDPK